MPDATIDELQAWLATDHGISVGHGTGWRAVDRLDRPRKKSLIATEQNAEQRATWQVAQSALIPDDLVLLDETSTQTILTRTYGRSPQGTRLVAAVPRNHGPSITCLAALSATGVGSSLACEGALDGPLFAQWITDHLVPTLHPGQIVILDNLSVHKHAEARDVLEAAGCQLRFLPTSSPDFNPIELIFSRLKADLRKVGARAITPLMDAIGEALTAITAADALACFRHAGYREA